MLQNSIYNSSPSHTPGRKGLNHYSNIKSNPNSYAICKDRPLIVGHRGMAGLLPENTVESLHAALYEGADFVEMDVILTKDFQPIVNHDVFLSGTTNIADIPEFAHKKQIRTYRNKVKDDWWITDFTLEEIKKIRVKQVILQNRPQMFNDKFSIPTLTEVIQMVIRFNTVHNGSKNMDFRVAGILLEVKDSEYHKLHLNTDINEIIMQTLKDNDVETQEKAKLKCPIVIMSFSKDSLKYFYNNSDFPKVYLVYQMAQLYPLKQINTMAQGVGIQLELIWDSERACPHILLQQLRDQGLFVYSWTIQDDNARMLKWIKAKNSVELYSKLMNNLKLDGIITEFPEKAVNIIEMLKDNLQSPTTSMSENQQLKNLAKLQMKQQRKKSI